MGKYLGLLIFILIGLITATTLHSQGRKEIFLRVNQVGYLSKDIKIAIAFSNQPLTGMYFIIEDAVKKNRVWGPRKLGENKGVFGRFGYHYFLDFSEYSKDGRYRIRIDDTNVESPTFTIGEDPYSTYCGTLLAYLRQQRCGYNPFLDEVCHTRDGRTAYAPLPDGTFIDVSGGWHDAGDYLRYLLTSGNTVCRLLFAYRENKKKFQDRCDALGHSFPDGVPDILNEAKWGLDWMFKMHPASNQLYHQVGDDRDHSGWDLPYQDTSDYGWGKGSYRIVYYATGKPQGLGKYRNNSTGIANLAGRYAAAMAMAAQIWRNDLHDSIYAARCLKAAKEVYEMGLRQPGCQEGTPHNQPYRYYENTWADDMEWGAIELYRTTGESRFLREAVHFARTIGATSWMGKDTTLHYQYYPFVNIAHYVLYRYANPAMKDSLVSYYSEGIRRVQTRAAKNPYQIGVPFIWCSNNLVAAFITQCILYEKMTGDQGYRGLMLAHRDWLFGKNPWGVSQFVGIPRASGNSPQHPHSVIAAETGRPINGGLNDGPVYASIFNSLKGIRLSGPDPYAPFQSNVAVYHDNLWDYSTNEPTLDGTAEALVFISFLSR